MAVASTEEINFRVEKLSSENFYNWKFDAIQTDHCEETVVQFETGTWWQHGAACEPHEDHR